MYWRGLTAQEKVKYLLLLVTLIKVISYFYTVLVLYKSRDERDERDCDLLVTLAKRQTRGFDKLL